METVVFALFAFLAVVSALVVVIHKNPIYSTMALVLTLFSMAVLFVMLGAPFIGALQILIYAGAIVVLFLFVIMLLNVEREEMPHASQPAQRWLALLGAGIFAGFLVLLFWRIGTPPGGQLDETFVSFQQLARELFSQYLLPFEIVGLLLLVAVIGATVAARRATPLEAQAGLRDPGEPLSTPDELREVEP
jgi:NADH-quinone oxidoreductase subunit J